MKHKGYLITFEGSEGSGKSTQIEMAISYLKGRGFPVVFTREPGGVKISERIRDILLDVKNEGMCAECEMLLYMAARSQLVKEVIRPGLEQGKIVLCDRYLDSTVAYQGYGNGVDLKIIRQIGKFATQDIRPDLTFVLDINTRKGLQRIQREKDRIERRALAYHERVRAGYHALARKEPRRVKLIPVDSEKAVIHGIVTGHLDKFLKRRYGYDASL